MTLPLPDVTPIRVSLVEDQPLELCGLARGANGLTNLEWTPASRSAGDDAGANLVVRQCPHEVGVHVVGTAALSGLPGFLADSLPDAWGRLLVDRQLRSRGIQPAQVGALDRLAIVGDRGPGALVFVPDVKLFGESCPSLDLDDLAHDAQVVMEGGDVELLDELMRAGGSAGGSRPKAWIAETADGGLRSGAQSLAGDEVGWLVKFRAPRHDPEDIGPLEMAYARMATDAGLDVAEPRLFETNKGRYFASRRFDREEGRRVHVLTLAGLLNVHASEAMAADYVDLVKVTRHITRSESETLAAYRHAVFNVLAHNRDDHLKQFAFRRSGEVWTRTPAYDLTFNEGPGGEHTLLVAGEGRSPGVSDLHELAARADIDRKSARQITAEVADAVSEWRTYAATVGASEQSTQRIWAHIEHNLRT